MSGVPRDKSRFDSSVPSRATPEQTLVTLMRRMVKEGKKELRVCLPGQIIALANNYKADIQPLLQSQYVAAQKPVTLPILPDVPISMPTGANFRVSYPLAVGDTGLLIFADRSLDAWLSGSGGITDPQDARLHDLTDAIFVPSLLPHAKADALADDSGDLVLQAGSGHVRVKQNGHVAVGNGTADLAALVQSLASQVQQLANSIATKPSSPGNPIDPSAAAILAKAKDIAAAASTIAP